MNALAVSIVFKRHAGRLEGLTHFLDTAKACVLAALKPVDGIGPNARVLAEISGRPRQSSAGHSALNWRHMVKILPLSLDSKWRSLHHMWCK
jgi:hypothetical protein